MENELRQALIQKERSEIFLANLENMHADKTVNDHSYSALKSEYASNLQHATASIDHLRQEIDKKIHLKSTELSIYRQELANLETRFKVGQLTAAAFVKASKKPQKKASEIEQQIAHFTAVLNAQHSNDVPAPMPGGVQAIVSLIYAPKKKPAPHMSLPHYAAPPQQPAQPPAPADATTVTNLQILPDRVQPGGTVGIVATLVNPGMEPIAHKAEFKVNQKLEAVDDILLNPGQSQEVTFMVVAGAPGDYYVSVDGAHGIFRVLTGM